MDLKQQKQQRCLLGSDDNCKIRRASKFANANIIVSLASYAQQCIPLCKGIFLMLFFFFLKKAAQKR